MRASPLSSFLRKSSPLLAPKHAVPRKRQPRRMLGSFDHVPLDMWRVNGSPTIRLRDYETQMSLGRRSYDLHLGEDGLVHPLEDPKVFSKPNGASLRPDGPTLQEIVRGFPPNACLWLLEEGLPLPKNLIMYHEHSDHYSLQTREPIPLDELNDQITRWLDENCPRYSQEEWCEENPF